MKNLKNGVLLFLVFGLSLGLAFFFENGFRKAIQALYVLLTNGDISFYHPKLDFHFASNAFELTFGFFTTLFIALLTKQTRNQRMLSMLFALVGFANSILIICYVDGVGKIAQCTACNDGKRKLHYGDINYDFVFIAGLMVALLPALGMFIKNRRKSDIITKSISKKGETPPLGAGGL